MSKWKDIETAPRDGSPVWVRGYNFGNPRNGRHYCWAYYEDCVWLEAASQASHLQYLEEWLPTPPTDTANQGDER